MLDLYVKELKKNNYKKNICFSVLLPILLFLRKYLLGLLPITVGSVVVPVITVIILGTMGIKFLSNIIRAVKLYRKSNKTIDIEYKKILKEKGMQNIKGIIYVIVLALSLFLRDYADVYFTSKLASNITAFSTLAIGSMLIGSVVTNSIELIYIELIYNKKKIKEVKNNIKQNKIVNEQKDIENKKTEKLYAIKKELEIYNNQLKNSDSGVGLNNENVKGLKK